MRSLEIDDAWICFRSRNAAFYVMLWQRHDKKENEDVEM